MNLTTHALERIAFHVFVLNVCISHLGSSFQYGAFYNEQDLTTNNTKQCTSFV